MGVPVDNDPIMGDNISKLIWYVETFFRCFPSDGKRLDSNCHSPLYIVVLLALAQANMVKVAGQSIN